MKTELIIFIVVILLFLIIFIIVKSKEWRKIKGNQQETKK